MTESTYLQMRDICKSFYGIPVLKDVNLSVRKGEVMALVGENGTGKSTLMKILFGIYHADSGDIFIGGKKFLIQNPKDAYSAGIHMIHQEMHLIPEFSIAQNILIGNEKMRMGIMLDQRAMNRSVQQLIDAYDLQLNAAEKIKNLSLSQRQMVEILKALYYKSNIVVMDEPTAALNSREVEILFKATRKLCQAGTSVIYISHRLNELPELADRITVMRDGEMVATSDMNSISYDQIVHHMVGRRIDQLFIKTTSPSQEVLMEVKNLRVIGKVHDVSFQIYKGEVLGLAGLMGARRTALVEAIYGVRPRDGGDVLLAGRPMRLRSHARRVAITPKDSIANGIGYLPEDRKLKGLVLQASVGRNITYPRLKQFVKGAFINEKQRKQEATRVMERVRIAPRFLDTPVQFLSGGNQQKVVMGRWLSTSCNLLILNEPTRGVDIGAKRDIYELIDSYVAAGNSVLLISSEMPELLNMSDRILVVNNGRIAGSFTGALAEKQEAILSAMLEVEPHEE